MDSIRYTYVEHRSKNHSDGVSDLTDGNAVTIIVHSQGNRSHTTLLDCWISIYRRSLVKQDRPPTAFISSLAVYTHWCSTMVWDSPVGTKRLQTIVKDMMEEAKIPGNFTNHSLRATGTTTLFNAGVPEALIQKRSGA